MIFNRMMAAPLRPLFMLVIDGESYDIDGTADMEQSGKFKYQRGGTDEWKLWVYKTAQLKFNFVVDPVAMCLVGRGSNGGRSGDAPAMHYGGGGGKGGVVDSTNQTFRPGTDYTITIGSDGTSISGDNVSRSVGVGGGANGGGGSSHNHESGYFSSPGDGHDGSYAFGNENFDGVKYGPGGGGGACEWNDYSPGDRGESTNIGAGGTGGHNYDGTTSAGGPGHDGAFMLWSETV